MKRQNNIPEHEDELMKFIFQVVENEKQEEGNPFLAERVMAVIENTHVAKRIPLYSRVLRIAAMAAGIALIIFTGINLGNMAGEQISESQNIVLLNDAHIERIEFLLTD